MHLLPQEVRIDSVQSWQDMTNAHFLPLDCQAANPLAFRASALVARFGESLAAELSVGASRVLRRKADAENGAGAFFKIFWQLSGRSRIQQASHTAELDAGAWSIYDTTREYAIESSERARFMVLLVPQAECLGWTPAVGALAGRPLDGGGAPRIVMSALAGMLRDGSPLDDESQRTLQDSVLALVERALDVEVARNGLGRGADSAMRLEKIKSWILDHLADPRLTPDGVAGAFGMSRRSLYNLFLAGQGTPRAFIQQARLDRARELLAHPHWREQPLAQIASRSGFADPAHFSRAFHARYGMPPSAWRELSAARDFP
jgi:AraC-like DNA-binding protein